MPEGARGWARKDDTPTALFVPFYDIASNAGASPFTVFEAIVSLRFSASSSCALFSLASRRSSVCTSLWKRKMSPA